MNESTPEPPPPLSPRGARSLVLILTGVFGIWFLLWGLFLGLDARDAALKAIVLDASALVGWGVLLLFGKPGTHWIGYSAAYGGLGVFLTPRVTPFTSMEVLAISLARCVGVALVMGTFGRWLCERTRRLLGPAIRPKTPEELARWRLDHTRPGDERRASTDAGRRGSNENPES